MSYSPVQFRHDNVLCLVGRGSGREVDAVWQVTKIKKRQLIIHTLKLCAHRN